MFRGLLGTGVGIILLLLPLLLLVELEKPLRLPLDMVTVVRTIAALAMIAGVVCLVLGLVGELVVNVSYWNEVRSSNQERMSDLSGRTRFKWGKKVRKCRPAARDQVEEHPCVLPPPRNR